MKTLVVLNACVYDIVYIYIEIWKARWHKVILSVPNCKSFHFVLELYTVFRNVYFCTPLENVYVLTFSTPSDSNCRLLNFAIELLNGNIISRLYLEELKQSYHLEWRIIISCLFFSPKVLLIYNSYIGAPHYRVLSAYKHATSTAPLSPWHSLVGLIVWN
jgi:hypothetical protein